MATFFCEICEDLEDLFVIGIQSQLRSHHQVQDFSSDHAKFKVQNGLLYCDGLLLGECTLRWLTFCPFLDFLQNVLYSNATNTL
jgi:hypothetical protein